MPKPCCHRQERASLGRPALRLWTVAIAMVCAACLGGCAGSSGSAADTAQYNSEGVLTSSIAASSTTAFAPTAAAVHSSAASQAADTLTAAAKPGNAAYKIGPLDVLGISVFKVPDLNKTVQVDQDGTIKYPLLGEVQAAGKTIRELESDLTAKLGAKYVRDPEVTVELKEFNSQRVTVTGAIKSSGVYALKGNTSLLQVVAMAGDVDTSTDSGNVVIFRTVNGQRSAAKFDIDAIKAGKAEDPQVQPGDVIVVDTSATKTALANVMKVIPLATSAVFFAGL